MVLKKASSICQFSVKDCKDKRTKSGGLLVKRKRKEFPPGFVPSRAGGCARGRSMTISCPRSSLKIEVLYCRNETVVSQLKAAST